MENTDVLIIGAGAAGLMAAYTLAKAGKKVTVLEARDRTGGRTNTIYRSHFFERAELGAEFIHGNVPITLGLVAEAGLSYHHAGGEMWRFDGGKFQKDTGMIEGWDELMQKLDEQQEEVTLNQFLDTHFVNESYKELKDQVRRYASGYDTSDPDRVSVLSLRKEWQAEDDDAQYRIDDGYCALIRYLTGAIKAAGGVIYLNAALQRLQWEKGSVTAHTADGSVYEAKQLLFAVPLGVWQAPEKAHGKFQIEPPITEQAAALDRMGFGSVIKVLLQFKEAFWVDQPTGDADQGSMRDMGFLFTEEVIPTWWTQAPATSELLTGWLGGPAADDWKDRTDEEILMQALTSLGNVFSHDAEGLKNDLIAWHVANWSAEPYTYGSYAYDTVDTVRSQQILNTPVQETLYFAGEFMYQGTAMGTVEAALTSGKLAAEKMI
ncbi:FAD-dependent oxidoreductase [Mucilaginibacter daejeonensis]|uniref:flavin monoamine oxidase family protein n=1 Tax=Mucilaginibacter daejeonensis TaxID=398049 RepID=UPI001D1741E2|nr:NAD(P)/FAD-dependent oxidoreductase [Mucilaginibacter daejeonensis]UEG54582.1 FAD-dependent oxidoreductase [Mucilaginibacter daejeonensis]